MKNKFIIATFAVALVSAIPALAETTKTKTEINAEASTTGNIVDDAKVAVKDMKGDASDAYNQIKATLLGKNDDDKNMPVVIDSRRTANGMIGHPVYNEKHENLAKITDIILDKDGKATLIIVSESMLGMGKKAAFDYSAITRVEEDGDVIMPLTEKIIDNAAPFSYKKSEGGEKIRVIPNNAISVAKILDGKLIDPQSVPLADINNISFKDGKADKIIVEFDKILGVGGGKKLALSYSNAKLVRTGDDLNFMLNAEKTAQFETHKKIVSN